MRRSATQSCLLAGLLLAGCAGPPPRPVAEEAQPSSADGPSADDQAYFDSIYAEARREWEPKARAGDAQSQRQLGVTYYLGQGVPQNFPVAFDWFSKAADQGDHVAQLSLGVMYTEGQGVPQDLVHAHMWLTLSAQQGNSGADTRLAVLTPRMSAEQVAEAGRALAEWKAGHPGGKVAQH